MLNEWHMHLDQLIADDFVRRAVGWQVGQLGEQGAGAIALCRSPAASRGVRGHNLSHGVWLDRHRGGAGNAQLKVNKPVIGASRYFIN